MDPIKESRHKRERNGKEKAIEHRQLQPTIREDTIMKEVDEFSLYVDLSDYEKEVEESRDLPP